MDDSPAGGLQPEEVPPEPCHSPGTGRPLPDLIAIHLAKVPDSWPPYDDELAAGPGQAAWPAGYAAGEWAVGGRTWARDSADDQDSDRAGGDGEDDRAGRDERAGQDERADDSDGEDDRAGRDGEGPGRWPNQFAQVLAETLAGSRPASQMTPWTTERARAHIRRLGPLLAAGQRPRVHRVLASRPVDDVVEIAVIVGFGPRTRALAARLERASPQAATPGRPGRQARWLCTAVESA
jgi:Family of unknown function (DUF6459)